MLYGSAKYGARSRCGHTDATSRPPVRQAASRRRKARSGSEKNIIPKREMIASNSSGGKSYSAASATTHFRLGAVDRSRATSIISGEMSIPQTRPSGPTRSAASIAVTPAPQPTSSTRSPCCRSTAEKMALATGISGVSRAARCASQNRVRSGSQPYVGSTLATSASGFLRAGFGHRFGKITSEVALQGRPNGRREVVGTLGDQRWQLEHISADDDPEHLGRHQTRTPRRLRLGHLHSPQYPTDDFEGEELADRAREARIGQGGPDGAHQGRLELGIPDAENRSDHAVPEPVESTGGDVIDQVSQHNRNVNRGEKQLLFGDEIVVHERSVHAGLSGNAADRRTSEAFGGECMAGRGQDFATRVPIARPAAFGAALNRHIPPWDN